MAIEVVGFITRHFRRAKKGCNMFKRMVLKRVWDVVQRLENAMKKRSAEWALLILKKVLN
jgi:hypothetical protein